MQTAGERQAVGGPRGLWGSQRGRPASPAALANCHGAIPHPSLGVRGRISPLGVMGGGALRILFRGDISDSQISLPAPAPHTVTVPRGPSGGDDKAQDPLASPLSPQRLVPDRSALALRLLGGPCHSPSLRLFTSVSHGERGCWRPAPSGASLSSCRGSGSASIQAI